jgi:hypothetical protein
MLNQLFDQKNMAWAKYFSTFFEVFWVGKGWGHDRPPGFDGCVA